MKQVFVFEVLLSPKGMPFQVRVYGDNPQDATLRVQRMHRQSMVRLLNAHAMADGVSLPMVADWQPGMDISTFTGAGMVSHRNASLL